MSTKVMAGAVQYARQHEADRIFCGHTHEAIQVEKDGIEYVNSGGWVDSRMTYVTVDEQGVQIHEFNEHEFNEYEYNEHGSDERADDRDSSQERGKADSEFADLADESGLLEDVEYANSGR